MSKVPHTSTPHHPPQMNATTMKVISIWVIIAVVVRDMMGLGVNRGG